MRPIKLYWCDRIVRGGKNFGDWLSPELVRQLSGREVESAPAHQAELVAIGSVLHRLPHHWWNKRLEVWGAGTMYGDRPVPARHRFHAVRGWLTQRKLRQPQVQVAGDPGLLVREVFPEADSVTKRWDVGLIPHHVDQNHESIPGFQKRVPGVRLLNILAPVKEFLTELAGCRFVLASCLHGLVAADALQIPNAWVTMSDEVRGRGFKFRDYYTAFGIDQPFTRPLAGAGTDYIEEARHAYARPGLEELQSKLLETFPRHR